MQKISYYSVPTWKAVFKVTADCCFEKVVYDGTEIGIGGKLDQEGDIINSWDLLCYSCNPKLTIIPISSSQYYQYRNDTIQKLNNKGA